MMELNSFSSIFSELKGVYSKQSSSLRGLDVIIFCTFLTCILQASYAAFSHAEPFNSLISSICGSLGLFVFTIALRVHCTPEVESKISHERAFAEFLACIALLFLFVWNIMI